MKNPFGIGSVRGGTEMSWRIRELMGGSGWVRWEWRGKAGKQKTPLPVGSRAAAKSSFSLRSGRLWPCPASVVLFSGGGNHSPVGMRAFALGEIARLPGGASNQTGKRQTDLVGEAGDIRGAGGLVKHGGD
jgi:hypothetical protein